MKNEEKIEKLSPMLDIVFKMLFASKESEESLISLLKSILVPSSPILSAEVLNPVIPKNFPDEKGIVLDILVKLDDGTQIDVEMQTSNEYSLIQRAWYYGARTISNQLCTGDAYNKLKPAIVIFLLARDHFPTEACDYHLGFEMHERRHRVQINSLVRLHFIEISKLIRHVKASRQNLPENLLELWGLFLYNPEDPAIREEIMKENGIKKAKDQLDALSASDEAKEIARLRENGLRRYLSEMEAAGEKGKAEGKAEGIAEGIAAGKAEGLAEGAFKERYRILHDLIKHMEPNYLTPSKLAQITGLSIDEIEAEIERLS